MTVSQIVPSPFNSTVALVREYQAVAREAGEKEFSHLALEGYVNAKVTAEGLRRAGRNLTRAGFMAAMDTCASTTWVAWKWLSATARPVVPAWWSSP